MMTSIEQHVEWIMNTITHLRDRQLHVIEATHDAQEKWVAHVNDEADKTLFPRANSWYIGANVPGKPRVFMPYVSQDYKQLIDEAVADDYRGFAMSA
jgi:cyclohexanone monooxygenase